jgi:hypothetical protein
MSGHPINRTMSALPPNRGAKLRTSGHSTVLLNLRAPNFDDIPQNRADEIRVIGNYFELSN